MLKRSEFSLKNGWHPQKFKRGRKALRTLKGYTGRVIRDLRRQLGLIPVGVLRETILDT